ncbi:hypothetical protein AX15_007872 [Amanita polypyramis BW_CC]|nr:hypothetical protein AX15_007872 [Amanita polypyramis BW_CC]
MDTFRRRFIREANTWGTLHRDRHENILELLGILNWNVPSAKIALVSPYQENGTILKYIKNNPEVDRKALVMHIARGLQHMHCRGIVHGDLKANNVLISKSGVALIADFGQSRILDHEAYTTFTGHRHTAIYLAPEIISYLSDILADNINSLKLNTKEADVYAFGITAAEVLKGEEYRELSRFMIYGIYKRVLEHGARPSRVGIPGGLYALLEKCWTANPCKRPEIGSVVERLGYL